MRKLIKFFTACAVVFLISGVGLIAAAFAMGADPRNIASWDTLSIERLSDHYVGIAGNVIRPTGDLTKSYSFSAVRKLDLEVDAGVVELKTGGTQQEIMVSYYGGDQNSFSCVMDGTTLKIESTRNWKKSMGREPYPGVRVEIIIPAEYLFDEVSLEMDAGEINVESIRADQLELQLGAGTIDVKQGNVRYLDADCSVGKLSYAGTVSSQAKAECETGTVVMKLNGVQTDFNYELDCDLGSIQIGDLSYDGISVEKRIDNKANKNVEIDCSIGTVEISFLQEGQV